MINALFRILALTKKELIAILKDPRGRTSLLIPPIIQCLIFGYAATFDLNNVPYAVLDQDHSAASRTLLSGFAGSPVFQQVGTLQRVSEIRTYIDERRALLVIHLGLDFEERLLAGQPADLQLIADGRNSNTAATARAYASAIIEAFNTEWRAAHGQAPAAIRVTTRAWYNPLLETRWNMIPGLIATLTMLQTLLLTALSVAREREQGTFDQLLVTPFRPVEIMAGKALPSIIVGLVMATNVLLVGQLWFHIPFAGSFITLYIGLVLFLLAAVGIGLFVSSFSATMQQAMLYSFVVLMPFILLSGLTTPISNMPDVLQHFTLLNPLRYAIEVVHRVYLEGAGLERLWPDLWPLALLALVTLSGSAWMFRRKLT